jgi:hypothetical protein
MRAVPLAGYLRAFIERAPASTGGDAGRTLNPYRF